MKILDLLKVNDREKEKGIWLSGVEYEGEFKEWHYNGVLYEHSNWKDEKLHGVEKCWDRYGAVRDHRLWKNDKIIKDYLK